MTVVNLTLILGAVGNSVFDDAPETEVARILAEFSAKILDGQTGDFLLRDANGNRIGSASLAINNYEAS